MSEDLMRPVSGSAALIQTAEMVARVGNRDMVLDLRAAFLQAVDTIERVAGIKPTTAEVRAFWQAAHRSNGAHERIRVDTFTNQQ